MSLPEHFFLEHMPGVFTSPKSPVSTQQSLLLILNTQKSKYHNSYCRFKYLENLYKYDELHYCLLYAELNTSNALFISEEVFGYEFMWLYHD